MSTADVAMQDPQEKFEIASGMFTEAANMYKIGKKWKEAGDAYCEAAEAELKREVGSF